MLASQIEKGHWIGSFFVIFENEKLTRPVMDSELLCEWWAQQDLNLRPRPYQANCVLNLNVKPVIQLRTSLSNGETQK